MKRLLLAAVLMAVLLVTGCGGGVETHTDPGQTIDVSTDQEFIIALGSNPTTGYSWQENYDHAMLELMEKTYELGEGAKQGMVGAGGVEHFRFKALKEGKTEVELVYKRPWEEGVAERKVFTVNVK